MIPTILSKLCFLRCLLYNALVVMNIEGDDEFNAWARKTAESVVETDNQIVYINIIDLKPIRSRITKLDLRMAA